MLPWGGLIDVRTSATSATSTLRATLMTSYFEPQVNTAPDERS
jgi:hypothetical protein